MEYRIACVCVFSLQINVVFTLMQEDILIKHLYLRNVLFVLFIHIKINKNT